MRGETKTKVVRVRVSPRILAYLQKIAYRKGRTVSEVVRKFIMEGIEKGKCPTMREIENIMK